MLRIRELQAVMGFNLDEIREILDAGDRMERLRAEYRSGVSQDRAAEIVREAARLNARTQEQVLATIALLQLSQRAVFEPSARTPQGRPSASLNEVPMTTRNHE